MNGFEKSERLKTYTLIALMSITFSWIVLTVIFLPLSILCTILGFVEYAKNKGEKKYYYLLYLASILIVFTFAFPYLFEMFF